MRFEQHCVESIHLFGTAFEDVHIWLDAFAGQPGIGMKHRSKRHHEDGIRQVRERWGDLAADVARRHIISDLQQEGWKESDHFPKDEADYKKMGLY